MLVLTVRPTRQHCGPATCGEAPHGQQTPHALAHQSWRVPSLCAPALDECVRVCVCSSEQARFARGLGQHGNALTTGGSVDIKAERTDFVVRAGFCTFFCSLGSDSRPAPRVVDSYGVRCRCGNVTTSHGAADKPCRHHIEYLFVKLLSAPTARKAQPQTAHAARCGLRRAAAAPQNQGCALGPVLSVRG